MRLPLSLEGLRGTLPGEARAQFMVYTGDKNHHFVRERGAPVGEYICRVYDLDAAYHIASALNAQYWGQRIMKEFERQMQKAQATVASTIAMHEANENTKH